jgi:SAM-dependent methyltransferase
VSALLPCWCGEKELLTFSPGYRACPACGSLVSAAMPSRDITRVVDDTNDFYGRDYWFGYQEQELGYGNIVARARADLPERCLYWLRTVLAHRLPPARVLDLGSGHGGLVMLLQRAGYHATGLELSPWVVDFARRTFAVPMLQGPLEDQSPAMGVFDVVAMMDVIEHLPDPVGTLRLAVDRLAEDGLVVVQTPCVPVDVTYDDMLASNHPFLPLMRERGHLYLFSQGGLRRLLESVGLGHVTFLPAIFAAYDMFAVAARGPLTPSAPDAIARALGISADGRLVQALLDLDDQLGRLTRRYEDAEVDRAARLRVIERQARELASAEADRAARLAVIERLGQQFAATEADRAARLAVIERLAEQFAAAEADRAARLVVIERLGEQLAAAEADRAARLEVIQQLGKRLEAVEADRAARLEVIRRLGEELEAAEADRAARLAVIERLGDQLATAEADRAARLEVIQRQGREIQAAAADAQVIRALRAELDDAIVLRGRLFRALRRWLRRPPGPHDLPAAGP